VLLTIIMLGAPGAGKGTQAKLLSKKLDLPHVSSGDIFRENIKNQTDLGKMAKTFMDQGELVPDDVTIAMIKDCLSRPDCEKGVILDGFPRTPAQAVALEKMMNDLGGQVDLVPFINVKDDLLIKRLSGRWTCRESGHIYNAEYSPPRVGRICDVDGSELYQREDDKAETVTKRIQVYRKQTAPLIEHYKKEGVLEDINGDNYIEYVCRDILAVLPKKIEH
jgi:adenylate kinase